MILRPVNLRFSFRAVLAASAAATAACSAGEPASNASTREQSPAAPVASIDAPEALALVSRGAVVIDVREPAELAESSKLRGAINVPLSTIRAQAARGRVPAELIAQRGRDLIFYCRSGRRSAEAAETVRQFGFTKVHNLGGRDDAAAAGYPVEAGARPGE